MTTDRWPKFQRECRTMRFTSSYSRTSPCSAKACTPCIRQLRTTASAASREVRYITITSAPASASRRATAAPIPRLPPDTSAACPASGLVILPPPTVYSPTQQGVMPRLPPSAQPPVVGSFSTPPGVSQSKQPFGPSRCVREDGDWRDPASAPPTPESGGTNRFDWIGSG